MATARAVAAPSGALFVAPSTCIDGVVDWRKGAKVRINSLDQLWLVCQGVSQHLASLQVRGTLAAANLACTAFVFQINTADLANQTKCDIK